MPSLLPSPEQLKANPDRLPDAVQRALDVARERADLRAFISLCDERARRSARHVRDRLLAGDAPPLAGWIIAVKDNIAVEGESLTCASRILDGYRARFTATAVERLEQAGAVVVGKTNLDEFAMGSSSENSAFGRVCHPLDPERVPGGSSGGSAVAVAAGIVHGALGSETGGSVRQPAAFCGVVGLKPTYGRVSRYGLVAFGSSLDQIGPFAASCAGVFDLLCSMAGRDRADSSSADVAPPTRGSGLRQPERPLRIGLPAEYFVEGLSPDIESTIRNVVEHLRRSGHSIVDVALPHTEYSIPVYYIIATAEASSNLARYDGVRYGLRSAEANDLAQLYEGTRGDGFGPEVKRRIMMGTFALSAGYFDAYYRKAQQVRRRITEDFASAFQHVDVLITPTTPTTAFRQGEKLNDPLAMYLSDIYTAPANLAGVPALSVPAGADGDGLPIGLQIIGPHFAEERILQLGAQIENLLSGAAA